MSDPKDDRPPRKPSELEAGVEQVSKVVGGVITTLFGSRATGLPRPKGPVLGDEADDALERLGSSLGRVLHAAGRQLEADPAHPGRALGRSLEPEESPELQIDEDDAPLSAGLRSFARGLSRSTEVLLDQVVPPDLGEASPARGEE
jgi:hypothetical protein